jgi:hypothetical protein
VSCGRLCRDKLMFLETLDAIKFICKDVWAACWDKQVDNLRTNHRVRISSLFPSRERSHHSLQGVYVLQDNSFKPISRISSWDGRAEASKRAKLVRPHSGPLKHCLTSMLDSTWRSQRVSSGEHYPDWGFMVLSCPKYILYPNVSVLFWVLWCVLTLRFVGTFQVKLPKGTT